MSQNVNKEVFKITIGDMFPLYELDNLSLEARVIVLSLSSSCVFFEYAKEKWNNHESGAFLTFTDINLFFKMNMEDIYAAAQELEAKGYIFRDTDGTLVFVNREAV